MATAYKTPGVYVEEIPKFPPSIAAVETAIPAFIGYTEKAMHNNESLINKPTRIESIADYEHLFGGSPKQDVTLYLDNANQFVSAEADAKLYLYDSLRMFYANGGGNCYIISAGLYPSTGSPSYNFDTALEKLEIEDEPTIILAPDAVSNTNGPYDFQVKALIQCNKLMDRVTVCDLTKSVENSGFKISVDAFRNNVGINYLKYGAAYGPWIKANLPRTLLRRNVKLIRDGGGPNEIALASLTNDAEIQKLITDLCLVESSVNIAASNKNELSTGNINDSSKSLEDKLKKLNDGYNAVNADSSKDDNISDYETVLQPLTKYSIDILVKIQLRFAASPAVDTNRFNLQNDINKYKGSSNIITAFKELTAHHKYLSKLLDSGSPPKVNAIKLINVLAPADLNTVAAFLGLIDWATLLDDPADVSSSYPPAAQNAKLRSAVAIKPILAAANEAIAFFHFLEDAQKNYEKTLNDSLLGSFGTYKNLVGKAADALNTLPPSGAIAGVWAATDRDRGVWKAPANVSLNSVTAPAVTLSHLQQGEYNVDVNAGKSINIIRSFTGKGTLVWGARTLAGNDNEWRYISVRRFFNFVEESVKKATEQFVFEPNDANTWVKVQAMIENFLTTQWRQGALQGIKPEHAFYVAVGIGKTMTALDILEGRMIIEIGMAVVRPAEFIILKFSHKMAES